MYLLLFVMNRARDIIERGVLTKWENCSPLFYLPGAAKLVEDVPDHVEDYDPHDLALDHDDAAAVVRGDSTGMLQDVGSELPDELSVLGEYLDLQCEICYQIQWTCQLFNTREATKCFKEPAIDDLQRTQN